MKKKFLLILLTVAYSMSSIAATWYVKLHEGAWTDKPAEQIKTTFIEAFTAAAANDEIWISSGILEIDDATAFNKHIKVYGSFEGNENTINERKNVAGGKAWEFENPTYVEQAEGKVSGFMTVPSGQNVLIDGLYFRNFNITVANQAVCNIRQNTRIENCVFDNNTTDTDGSAVRMYPGGHLINSYIYKNKAKTSTIFINALKQPASVIGCTIEANEAGWASALNCKYSGGQELGLSYIIRDNIVINNKANLFGNNSIVNITGQEYMVSNMLIANNSGGVALNMESGTFANGTIVNNISAGDNVVNIKSAGGVITPGEPTKLYNTVIWNNRNESDVLSVVNIDPSPTTNADFQNNASDVVTSGVSETATEANFILLEEDNTGEESDKNYAAFLQPTNIIGASETEQEAINQADWSVGANSALIDAGSDALVPGSTEEDILGNNRFVGTVDIGAYENDKLGSSVAYPSISNTSCYYAEGTLHLRNVEAGDNVSIYNINGSLILTKPIAENIQFPLAKGVYVVRIGSNSSKLIVR